MIIRHKRFFDVCFEIKGEIGRWKHGNWINMGYVKSWYLNNKSEDLWLENGTDWELCLEPHLKCLRYAKWKAL